MRCDLAVVISRLLHPTKCQTSVRHRHTLDDNLKNKKKEEVEEFTFNPSTHVSPPIDINHYSGPYIHRLPLELLQQVFLLIVNDVPGCPSIFSFEYHDHANRSGYYDEQSFRSISANFASSPLVFTRVCRFLGVVAYSTPKIWSRIRVVTLCEGRTPLRPFLPSLLRFWLARSGSEPLTLHIVARPLGLPRVKYRAMDTKEFYSQLHGILFAEMGRLETVTVSGVPPLCPRRLGFNVPQLDTPQLKTLECHGIDLDRFNAPNLRRLRIFGSFPDFLSQPTPTTTSILHLHLKTADAQDIYRIAVTSPHLETLVADRIYVFGNLQWAKRTTHPCLASITLPVFANISLQQAFIDIFDGLYLPKLQGLTLVGELREPEVSHVMAALEVASCHVRTVEFRTDTPWQSEVDVGSIIEPLLSVVEEVTVRHGVSGELLFRCGKYYG